MVNELNEQWQKNVDLYLTLKARGLTLDEVKWLESNRLYKEESLPSTPDAGSRKHGGTQQGSS